MPTGVTGFTARNVPYFDDTLQAANIGDGIVALTTWINLHPGVSVETTTSRNALAGADLWDGRIIWNQTTLQLEKYDTGSATWRAAAPTTGLASTVVGPDNNGAAASVGTSGLAARADHDHGTPAIVGGTLPTTQAFGDAPSAGTAVLAAHRDHLHGMPAAPAASAMSQIANSVLGSAAASVTFSSIPGTFNHLQLMGQARSTAAAASDEFAVQLNGDTGSNYLRQSMFGNGSGSASASIATTSSSWTCGTGDLAGATATAGFTGLLYMSIPLYAGTTWAKTVNWHSGLDDSLVHSIVALTGTWNSTAAVTSVKVFALSGPNFAAGSAFYLYGVT